MLPFPLTSLPGHFLEPVTIHRFKGHFTQDGDYVAYVDVLSKKCFMEPCREERLPLKAQGRMTRSHLYAYLNERLFIGRDDVRDILIYKNKTYRIKEVESWPLCRYWCALLEPLEEDKPYEADVINKHVRQFLYAALHAAPGTICPAYQEAPVQAGAFIVVQTDFIEQAESTTFYHTHAQGLEESLTYPSLMRAKVLFYHEGAQERAEHFYKFLGTTSALQHMHVFRLGLVKAYLPKRQENDETCVQVTFDFYRTDHLQENLDAITSTSCQVSYNA